MRIVCGLILSLIVFSPFAEGKPKDKKGPELERYTSTQGKFRVLLPDDDDHEDSTLATAVGPVRIRTVRGDVGRELALAVSYTDYPHAFATVSATKLLDGVRDGLKGIDGTVESESDFTLGSDGPLGREILIVAGRNAIRCKAVLVGSRLYQVMATGDRDAVTGRTAAEFFDSFELMK